MKKKILVVDDEQIYRLLLTKIFLAAGYDIVEADSAEKAIGFIKDAHPDLIVCDMKMPGGDGLEVLAAIKSEPTTVHIPFVFLTSQAADQHEVMKFGADEYLLKPVDRNRLLSVVNMLLV